MINLDELIRDQYKYEIRCSRCGGSFWSIVEILDIIPAICGNCHICMPVKFVGNVALATENSDC